LSTTVHGSKKPSAPSQPVVTGTGTG
jgi:hypothetical protein